MNGLGRDSHVFEQSQYSSTGKRPAPTSLGEEWGQEHLCQQKVPAPPLQGWVPKGTPPPTPQGVVASDYGLQGPTLMTWEEKQQCSDIPLSSLQHSMPPFPRVRMVKAAPGSRAKAPDCLCPSEDPFSFKTTPLKNTNKTALPVSSLDAVLFPS